MRSFAFAFALLTSVGAAQSPLNALTGGTNSGNSGGGLYFNLDVSTVVTLTQIDVLCGPSTTPGPGNTPLVGTSIMELWLGPTTYVGNVTNPGLWTPVVTGTGTVGPSQVASFVLNIPIALAPGSYGVALKSLTAITGTNAQWGFGYTNGAGNNTPLVCGATPGSCLNSIFSNTELTIRAGAAQNAFLTGGVFQPRVFNGAIHYTLGGQPVTVASTEPYGTGCYDFYHSFRELFPNPVGFDLENLAAGTNTILMTLNASGGYDVSPLNPAGTFFPPGTGVPYTGGPTPGTPVIAANLTLAPIPLPFPMLYPTLTGPVVSNTIEVSDDGYVSPAGTGIGAPLPPTPVGLLGGPPRWAPCYYDQNPVPGIAGAGVFVDLDPSLTQLYVTWNLLPVAGSTIDPSTFQLMLRANGDVEYRYQTMSGNGGGSFPMVTGWSVGGGVLDPGQRDLSATGPFSTRPGPIGVPTYPNDNPGLNLALSARPRLGTTPNLVTTNIPSGTALGVNILSFVQIPAGLDLAGFGAPGCSLYANTPPSTNMVFIVAPPGGTSNSTPFPIPNNAAFNGILVFGQSATFTSGYNALGILFSNGARMLVGSL